MSVASAILKERQWLAKRLQSAAMTAAPASPPAAPSPRPSGAPAPSPVLHLGTNLETGNPILLRLERFHEHNIQIIGASRTGKTRMLRRLGVELLPVPNATIVLFSAKGGCARDYRDRVLQLGYGDRLIWVDPADHQKRGISLGYDLMRPNNLPISLHVKQVRETLVHGHGQAHGMADTQQMAKFFYLALYVARALHLTLTEGLRALRDDDFRKEVIKQIDDPAVCASLLHLDGLSDSRQDILVAPPIARLEEIVNDEILRHTFCQQAHSFSFGEAIPQHKVVIFNLEMNVALRAHNVEFYGRTVLNDLIGWAFQYARRYGDIYVLIDEAHYFVTEDMCRVLDSGHEVGLHAAMCHHYMSQMDLGGNPVVKDSLMNNAGIKCVFRIDAPSDQEFWSQYLFYDRYDPWRKKHSRLANESIPEEETRTTITKGRGTSREKGLSTQQSTSTASHDLTTLSATGGTAVGEARARGVVDGVAAMRATQITSMQGVGIADVTSSASGSGTSLTTGTTEYTGGALPSVSPAVTHQEGEHRSSAGGKSHAVSDFSATAFGETQAETHQHADIATHSTSTVAHRAVTTGQTSGTVTSETTGRSQHASEAESESYQESVHAFMAMKNRLVEVDVQFMNREEHFSLGAQAIGKLAMRCCYLKIPGIPAILERTADEPDANLADDERERLMEPVYALDCYNTVDNIRREEQARAEKFQPAAEMGPKKKRR
jgi:hypothetical protein